jgi:hypothetical protein
MPQLTRPKAGIPNWSVEVNADVGAEHGTHVRIVARSAGTARLTGPGMAAMLAALNTYYAGGKAASILQSNRDTNLLCSVARDSVVTDVLPVDKETVVASIQTVLLASANVQLA